MITAGMRRLSQWAAPSVNRRIFVAVLTVGGFTLLVKGSAVFKELVSAYQFGTGRELDALLIAWALPTFVINVLGGSLQAALVPVYLETIQRDGHEAGRALVGSMSVAFLLLLVLVSLAFLALSGWLLRLMGSGFSPAELELCRDVFYVLLPTMVLTGLARLYGGVLVAQDRFAVTTAAMLTTPLLSIVCMLLLTRVIGIYSLALGILLGAFLELAILLGLMFRERTSLSFRWHGLSPALRQVGTQYAPVIAGSVLMAGTVLTDQGMAGMLSAGAVSSLNYANKIPSLILNLTSGAIGTAVLPYFSRMVAAADWKGVRHTFRTYIKLILVTTVPATAVLTLLSGPTVHLLFQRGAFTPADTQLVSLVQICLLIQVPFYTLGILAVRLVSSLQANRILMWGSAISLALNAALDYLLMQYMGVAGIALATSFVYVVAFIYLFMMVTSTLKKRSGVPA